MSKNKKRIQAEQICIDSGLHQPAIVFTAGGGMLRTSPVHSFFIGCDRSCRKIETENTIYYVA